jgi:hypothetical protein
LHGPFLVLWRSSTQRAWCIFGSRLEGLRYRLDGTTRDLDCAFALPEIVHIPRWSERHSLSDARFRWRNTEYDSVMQELCKRERKLRHNDRKGNERREGRDEVKFCPNALRCGSCGQVCPQGEGANSKQAKQTARPKANR